MRTSSRIRLVLPPVVVLVSGPSAPRREAVAWISARADLLCAMFVLLAVWAYLRAVEHGGPARSRDIIVSTLWFVAALLSKGVALPLPAVLLLLDIYPLRRLPRLGWGPLVREKIELRPGARVRSGETPRRSGVGLSR